ncbi:hypothetical protein RHMOL_Rhmol04G0078100 [Rhododendron molle]|uniref:Uncharacterized protein n=1 Tax=Rhododendron molle TaxID=49168 RepID=A0ACC0NZD0_RHOML|nr:hypothetical protein RHMOL_Rhmol04G0078100 [Rhododendron molle]
MEKQNRAISFGDDSKPPSHKVKLMCSYGVKIQPRPHDHHVPHLRRRQHQDPGRRPPRHLLRHSGQANLLLQCRTRRQRRLLQVPVAQRGSRRLGLRHQQRRRPRAHDGRVRPLLAQTGPPQDLPLLSEPNQILQKTLASAAEVERLSWDTGFVQEEERK